MTAPDFLVIGHVVKDVTDTGWRFGGTVTYAATQASRLGLRAAVVTRAASDVDLAAFLLGVDVALARSEATTTFENRYDGPRRIQHVRAKASPIEPRDIPSDWRKAGIVLLGPVLDEVSIDLAEMFDSSIVAFCPQGWLREVRPDGLVNRRPWPESNSVRGADVVIVSDGDIEHDVSVLDRWQAETSIVVVTEGKGGARIYSNGRWRKIGAFPHREVDPTGAGDVFATAFVIALEEKGSVEAAAKFAAAAAGLSVEAQGIEGVATRPEIEAVLTAHPEVTLE
jgi:1D-myo-inositol 3-kinase